MVDFISFTLRFFSFLLFISSKNDIDIQTTIECKFLEFFLFFYRFCVSLWDFLLFLYFSFIWYVSIADYRLPQFKICILYVSLKKPKSSDGHNIGVVEKNKRKCLSMCKYVVKTGKRFIWFFRWDNDNE